jgi:hypothetical protein
MVADHTGYWQNLEEVIFPLGQRIARRVGVPVHGLLAGDAAWCEHATSRRRHRVRWLSGMRGVWVAGAAWAVWQGFAAWWAFLQLLTQQAASFGAGDPARQAAIGSAAKVLVPELLLWIVLPFAVLSLAWRWWELHEQRAFLLRRHPNPFLETLMVVAMSAATAVPAGRASALAWGDAASGAAAAFIFIGSIFTGIFYVFSLHGPQRSFAPALTPKSAP